MFSNRPSASETDEDLLEQQNKFLRELQEKKITPSAKLISPKSNKNSPESEQNQLNKDVIESDIQEQIANTFEAIPSVMNIGNVIEKRKIDDVEYTLPVFSKMSGFPVAKRREIENNPTTSGSIFSRKSILNKPVFDSKMDTDEPALQIGNVVKDSKLLTESEKAEIHTSNLKLLKSTPESEILEERERILSTMDPAIVEFLRSRKKNPNVKSTNPSIHQQNEIGKDLNVGSIKAASEVLEVPGSEKWLNFDLLETHKLAWMKDLDGTVPKIDKNKAFEARFDFQGFLMPFDQAEINDTNRILYHHGEEPNRPGYSLQELFTLSRSSVVQQKIIGLNTISNILSLFSSGIYQDILDVPIEQIFFLIRFCLDDNTPSVVTASLKALRSLFYNQIDEICLDCVLSFGDYVEPILPVDELEDDDRVNDQQMAEKNLIKCLVRTGIFTRIRYILNTMRPSLESVVYCIEICIRLVRDSEFVLNKFIECDDLISSIFQFFIPSALVHNSDVDAYGKPLVQAVKLARIFCSRNVGIATNLVEKYKLIDSISNYLQDDTFGFNANGMKLQIESLHLWRILLEYNLTFEYLTSLENILLNHLQYHYKNTDISNETSCVRERHCSAVLLLLARFLEIKPSCIVNFEELIESCVSKWCTQFGKMEQFKCEKSQILSSLLRMCTVARNYSKLNEFIQGNVVKLVTSVAFNEATKNLMNCSMLLNNYEPHQISGNLKNLQTAAWYTIDHVVPIIQTNSCFPFLKSFYGFVLKSDNIKLKLSSLQHLNVENYLKMLVKRKTHFLTNHWFTRIESELLMRILKISVDAQQDLDTSVFYALAVTSLCVFNENQKEDIQYLFEKIIFNSQFYPSENLLSTLSLEEPNERLEVSLKNLDEIQQVYTEILGLKLLECSEKKLYADVGKGNIIPVDWTYSPIILLYSNQQDNKRELDETQRIFIVKNCLLWILIYEIYFPTLVATLNSTDRFCRLSCVFLGDDCLFLNEEIHSLLEMCLKNILDKFEENLDFNKPIQGLKNFQDFYNQMLEQYQGVSYGDQLFGNFVLVPLSQKQNVQWRKTLWSEYMGVVQILNIPKDKLMTKLENFLYPIELDESLLNCYKSALSTKSVRTNSILHTIASHHYKEYLNRKMSEII